MPVKIHGNDYYTVAERIAKFREEHPDWTIETQMISADGERVIMKALIMTPCPGTVGEDLLPVQVISTGYAEETRSASAINTTSALENAETSAVGRALAFFGLAGTEIRSADELVDAIAQQKEQQANQYLKEHNMAWKEHEESIHAIKTYIDEGNIGAAWEAWMEIPDEDRMTLKVAPTKGGWMRKEDKEGLAQASKDDFDADRGVYKSIADRGKDNE